MFLLAGSSLPDSTDSLLAALRSGFESAGVSGAKVSAQGAWPALTALEFDLSGAAIDQAPPMNTGTVTAEFSAETFSLRGSPAHLFGAPVEVDGRAQNARFGMGTSPSGGFVTLRGAGDGSLSLGIALADLEQALLKLGTIAASKHGAEVRQLRLRLTPRGPRQLAFSVEVTAKAFIATTTVTVSGEAEIDDQLVARLSNLRFDGSGMIANLAGGMVQPVLARLEGKPFPLNAFTGQLKVHDVAVSVTDRLQIAARFRA